MAVIGAHLPSSAQPDHSVLEPLLEMVDKASTVKPDFWELASVTDTSGFLNTTVIAYWPSKAKYNDWCSTSGFDEWWAKRNPEVEKHGWFREVLFPPIERFETVFSDNVVPEGAAHMREAVSEAIQEHVYWGSARDRLPVAQTDSLVGQDAKFQDFETPSTTLKSATRIPGTQNMCIIRSGQDWSNTYPEERKLYLETVHPVLIKGMDFLRDNGEEVGCYSCRFVDVLDNSTLVSGTDRTFGLAYFDSLASLEKWSKEHKTHLDIFGRFLQYAKELQGNVSLRLFHEILVLAPDQQLFEYIGCHSRTGMLVARHAA